MENGKSRLEPCFYVLGPDRKTPIPVNDALEWARYFEREDRRVALTKYWWGTYISTVFLGIDHSFGRSDGGPVLWETMVFGGDCDGEMARYSSYDSALAGHERMVKLARLRDMKYFYRWPVVVLKHRIEMKLFRVRYKVKAYMEKHGYDERWDRFKRRVRDFLGYNAKAR